MGLADFVNLAKEVKKGIAAGYQTYNTVKQQDNKQLQEFLWDIYGDARGITKDVAELLADEMDKATELGPWFYQVTCGALDAPYKINTLLKTIYIDTFHLLLSHKLAQRQPGQKTELAQYINFQIKKAVGLAVYYSTHKDTEAAKQGEAQDIMAQAGGLSVTEFIDRYVKSLANKISNQAEQYAEVYARIASRG